MAITISGENNNDRILASDGVIDQISGINFSGIITASHIDVGSNIQLGNAGIITATTFVGNVTGNVNSTSPLLLQTGGSERFRITGNNELGIAGANYGSSGQVLTSGGSGSAVSWTTPAAQISIVNYADNKLVTATGNATSLNAEANLTWDGSTLYAAGGDAQLRLYDTTASSENSAIRIMAYNGVNYIQSAKSFESDSKADLIFSSYAGATQYLRLKSTGQLNLGTSTAVQTQSNYKAQFETGTNKKISFYSVTHDDLSNEGSGIAFSRQNDGSDLLSGIFSHSNGGLGVAAREGIVFLTGGGSGIQQTEEAVRITSTGKVLIGHDTPIEIGVGAGYQMPLQVIGTSYDTSGMVLARYQDNNGGPTLAFVKSRNATKGAQTIVQANDNLGMIRFLGSDGTDTQNAAARIRAFCDGTPASNKIPGRIVFETTSTLQYAQERMRIDSAGRVVIGGEQGNAGASGLYIGGAALAVLGTGYTPNTYACFAMGRVGANVTANTTITNIRLNGGTLGTGRGAEINAAADANWSDASSHPTRLTFHTVASGSTSSTERLRIKSDGNITISNTATSPTGDFRMLTLIARSDKQASIGFAQASGVYSGATATAGYTARLAGDAALEFATHNSNIIAFKATQTGNVEMVGDLKTNNLSGRNIVINGDMRVAQKATSASMSNHGNDIPVCDRWNYNRNGASATVARVSDAPAGYGFRYSLKWTNTSPAGSISAGNALFFVYKIERQDIQRLGYGSSGAKKATISFWAKGSLAGKIGMSCSRDGKIFSQNVDMTANTWQFHEIVIPADTSTGFSANDNANGFTLRLCWGAGSNSTSGHTNSWINYHNAYTAGFTAGQQGAYLTTNGSTFQITGVQLEVGSQSTPFEHRPISEELARCQRYLFILNNSNSVYYWFHPISNNTNYRRCNITFPTTMRTGPTASELTGNNNGSGGTPTGTQHADQDHIDIHWDSTGLVELTHGHFSAEL